MRPPRDHRDALSLVAGFIVALVVFMGFSVVLVFGTMLAAKEARNATPVPPTPLHDWTIPDGFAMSPVDSEVAYRIE